MPLTYRICPVPSTEAAGSIAQSQCLPRPKRPWVGVYPGFGQAVGELLACASCEQVTRPHDDFALAPGRC